ncbi:hypothetical protein U27_02874 [Candidatus Vecturithrix granuli]|uniref:Uncharacterized protein n=1 Tax=Vecturithrix granuli TaxID=1499967 RepID=A0A081BUA8_VECG1|nr:hypothetical protein U27_02874 [Candidatus Vecturithrix granuli]
MGPFEVAALGISGWIITRCFSTWTKAKQGGNAAKLQELERRIQELEAREPMKALQERVQTLEDIVVADDLDLKKKFRHLDT